MEYVITLTTSQVVSAYADRLAAIAYMIGLVNDGIAFTFVTRA